LAASLKKLLKKKFLDDITVKEIVEDCAVNRQTFYYHFQDIYDLLRFFLERETCAALQDSATWQEAVLRAFRYIQGEHVIIYHIFLSDGREHLDCQVYTLSRRIIAEVLDGCSQDLELSEPDRRFLEDFYMYALSGLMVGWMARDMKEEPEALVAQLDRLLDGEFRRMAEKFALRRPAVRQAEA